MDQLINKIKTKGYWRVEIRPTKFEKLRIPTLSQARKIVESCAVLWRGWDYPHFHETTVQNRSDWVESWVDWQQYLEYWQFYHVCQKQIQNLMCHRFRQEDGGHAPKPESLNIF